MAAKEQPRVPAGSEEGGQWTEVQGNGRTLSIRPGGEVKSDSDAPPDRAYEDAEELHAEMMTGRVPLSKKEERAENDYRETPGYYERIANDLRGTNFRGDNHAKAVKLKKGEVQATIKSIDAAIAKQEPLKDDIVVYRGFRLAGVDQNDREMSEAVRAKFVADNGELMDRSFVSTSLDPEMARVFARSGAVLRIRIPKGSRVLPVSPSKDLDLAGSEREVLLGRGSRIRLIRSHTGKIKNSEGDMVNNDFIDAEVVTE